MRIVSIEKARRGGKFKVSLDSGNPADGDYVELLLSKEVIVDYGLRRNDELTAENIQKIQASQLYHDTYFAAMRLINYRMRTTTELARRLREKKYPDEIIQRVIEKLGSLGLTDDGKFAEIFVAGKVAQKPVGKRELERKLREKGISKETVTMALAEVSGDERQLDLALQAAETKVRSLGRYDAAKRKEKLAAFLARRGFDWDIIKKAIAQVLGGDRDVGVN